MKRKRQMTKVSSTTLKTRSSLVGLIIGFVGIVAWTVAAALMALSFGLWGWVVWPAAVMFILNRTMKGLAAHLQTVADTKLESDPLGALADLLRK